MFITKKKHRSMLNILVEVKNQLITKSDRLAHQLKTARKEWGKWHSEAIKGRKEIEELQVFADSLTTKVNDLEKQANDDYSKLRDLHSENMGLKRELEYGFTGYEAYTKNLEAYIKNLKLHIDDLERENARLKKDNLDTGYLNQICDTLREENRKLGEQE